MAGALMLQGTGSDVGKSLLAAGLCRAFTRRGLTVRPFKPQNMSNNAAVTADGGEIGRAQALQARACGLEPVTDMNPVLLKPQTEIGAQVVVHGRVAGNANARDYQGLKPGLMPKVLESFERISDGADLVVVEGAGSAAEINLRAADIANMGFAEAADVPVVLIGDIDRGGVIAQIVGTHVLLSETERALTKGFIVNKFRGDLALFDDGVAAIVERTGLASFGVVPWFEHAHALPREDAYAVDDGVPATTDAAIRIAVPVLSRIANFDDLDPLRAEPGVRVDMIRAGQPLPGDADLVILPGSKATLTDLAFFRAQGWDVDLAAHVRRGGRVLGICAGLQMLGRTVADPDGTEGRPGEAQGLGLLDIDTVLAGDKRLEAVTGQDRESGQPVSGYEMHIGRTAGPGLDRPMLDLAHGPDGAVSADGRVMGCYVHGLFAADEFRRAFLQRLGTIAKDMVAYEDRIETLLDDLASHLDEHLDLPGLLTVASNRQAEEDAATKSKARSA